MLYIVEDTSFVSNEQPSVSASAVGERVQARWPRITARQIAGTFGREMGRTPH
jgi:hypothetical protein